MGKAKKQPQVKVTYNGDLDAIDYQGYHMPKGEPVEVDESFAKSLIGNDYFDVEGVEADDPASTVAPEDALAAERVKHQAEIDQLNAEHSKALQDQADSLKAGWQEQHDAMQAEIDQLNAEHSKALQDQADSLKAGWQEQHDAMQAEIDQLKAQIGGAAQQQPQG
ncbi:hypothetical protein [Paraburkholderia caribensis]|uniref:hypothetical protein n=1 Tax=Paraburkholderia caribensis TaxID=75105 RepID=UPI0034D3475F